jgi:Cu-Zn family superoxide dismutase
MFAKQALVLAAGLSIAVVGGCKSDKDHRHDHGAKTHQADAGKDAKTAVAKLTASKIATTQPAVRNVAGEVRFSQVGDGVKIVADVTGLEPGKKHGFHIHEKGDLSAPDLNSAGPHYDPAGTHQHGPPSAAGKTHAGDLGNLEANDKGVAHLEITVPNVSLGGKNDLVGRSVIVHAKADDLKSNPAGDSGARIAGGKIEMGK